MKFKFILTIALAMVLNTAHARNSGEAKRMARAYLWSMNLIFNSLTEMEKVTIESASRCNDRDAQEVLDRHRVGESFLRVGEKIGNDISWLSCKHGGEKRVSWDGEYRCSTGWNEDELMYGMVHLRPIENGSEKLLLDLAENGTVIRRITISPVDLAYPTYEKSLALIEKHLEKANK